MRNPCVFDHPQRLSWRLVLLVILVLLTLGISIDSGYAASATRAYAGIVVDAKTGKTLYQSAADAPRYPASVTKVMTLYILFEELEAGRLKLNSRLTVSKHAAAAVPTKLGLKAGSTIRVEDAIKALVTLSANDMARTIAEAISGTESQFAQRMTKTARALGMSRTTYKNASGLPDRGQVTTVRDQARLGIAIYEHFPDYYEFFQTRVFKYNGRRYGNHNQLLGSVPGVDGIKTGYIRAAGYNLLTAARKDGRHIVVAGFGFDTGASRNAKVTSLVKKYLPKARSGTYLATAQIPRPSSSSGGATRVASAQPAPLPDFRRIIGTAPAGAVLSQNAPIPQPLTPPVAVASRAVAIPPTPVAAATMVATSSDAPKPAEARPFEVIGAWMGTTFRLDTHTGTPIVPPAPINTLRPPVAVGSAVNNTIDLLTSGSIDTKTAEAGADDFGWVVQIGAAPSEAGAESLLADAAKTGMISDFRRYVQRIERNGQIFYRARITGFTTGEAARATCEDLKKINMSCLAIQG